MVGDGRVQPGGVSLGSRFVLQVRVALVGLGIWRFVHKGLSSIVWHASGTRRSWPRGAWVVSLADSNTGKTNPVADHSRSCICTAGLR